MCTAHKGDRLQESDAGEKDLEYQRVKFTGKEDLEREGGRDGKGAGFDCGLCGSSLDLESGKKNENGEGLKEPT